VSVFERTLNHCTFHFISLFISNVHVYHCCQLPEYQLRVIPFLTSPHSLFLILLRYSYFFPLSIPPPAAKQWPSHARFIQDRNLAAIWMPSGNLERSLDRQRRRVNSRFGHADSPSFWKVYTFRWLAFRPVTDSWWVSGWTDQIAGVTLSMRLTWQLELLSALTV